MLQKSPMYSYLPAKDVLRARRFYEGRLGFQPKYTIEDAVRGLCKAFKAGKLPESMVDDIYFNVRRMKRLGITGPK